MTLLFFCDILVLELVRELLTGNWSLVCFSHTLTLFLLLSIYKITVVWMKCGTLSLNRKKQNHTRPGDFRAGVVFSVYRRKNLVCKKIIRARRFVFRARKEMKRHTERLHSVLFAPFAYAHFTRLFLNFICATVSTTYKTLRRRGKRPGVFSRRYRRPW